jgi:fucose permease
MDINLLDIANKMIIDGATWQEVLIFFAFFSSALLIVLIIVSGIVKIVQAICLSCTPMFNSIAQALTQKKPARVPTSTPKDQGQ